MNCSQDIPYINVDLNDKRLTKRFNSLLQSFQNNYSGSIPQATQGKAETKAAYRFFHNKKVNSDKLIEAHRQHIDLPTSPSGCSKGSPWKEDFSLCLSDTTVADYSCKRGAKNMGYLTRKYLRGFYLHNDLIVSSLGVPSGLLKQQFNHRQKSYFGNSEKRKNWPIEKKESIRWLHSYEMVQQYSEQNNMPIVHVADREADIIELYNSRWNEKAHLLIRAQFDRSLVDQKSTLFSYLKQQAEVGTYQIEVIDPKTLKKRTAQLAIRFCSVQLDIKSTLKHKQQQARPTLNAIEVYEINAPQDVEKPIRWVLLTTLPITNFDQARCAIQMYVKRWLIERFHYLLKTGGANIEQLQFESPRALQNVVTTYSITIMETMKLRYLAENQPDMKVYEAGISQEKCKILYAYAQVHIRKDLIFDPDNPPSVWEFCRVLGMLGGFIPRRSQPLPGLKILTRATEKFNTILSTYDVILSMNL